MSYAGSDGFKAWKMAYLFKLPDLCLPVLEELGEVFVDVLDTSIGHI